MKRLILVIAIFLFAIPMLAQVKLTKGFFGDRAFLAQFPNTKIDSLATVYSEAFTLAGHNVSFVTSPIYWTRKLTSASGKPRIINVVQGSNDLVNWLAVDTLSVNADSTETLGMGTMTLHGTYFAWYRFAITGTATNRKDTYCKFEIYLPYERK